MTKIFQRFDLDFKALVSLLGVDVRKNLGELSPQGLEVLKDSKFAQATSVLRKRLVKKGYEVLESNDVYCGLHGSIILGGEIGKMDLKGDFYEITGEFKMPYHSGSSYSSSDRERCDDFYKRLRDFDNFLAGGDPALRMLQPEHRTSQRGVKGYMKKIPH